VREAGKPDYRWAGRSEDRRAENGGRIPELTGHGENEAEGGVTGCRRDGLTENGGTADGLLEVGIPEFTGYGENENDYENENEPEGRTAGERRTRGTD
jgi:hypothetical protein